MVAIIILSILVTIAAPIYNKAVERSHLPEAYAQLALIKQAEMSHHTEHDAYTGQWYDLDMDDPNSNLNRYFEYSLGEPNTVPRIPWAWAVRNDYQNPFGFEYNVILDINWNITVNGFWRNRFLFALTSCFLGDSVL